MRWGPDGTIAPEREADLPDQGRVFLAEGLLEGERRGDRAALQQDLDGFLLAEEDRYIQRSGAVVARSVQVRAVVDELVNPGGRAVAGGAVERRFPAARGGSDLGPVIEEKAGHAFTAGQVERRFAVTGCGIDRSSLAQEESGDREGVGRFLAGGCEVQGLPAVAIVVVRVGDPCIDGRSTADEIARDFPVAVAGGFVKRLAASLVAGQWIGTVTDQEFDEFEAPGRCPVDRLDAIAVAGGDVGAASDQQPGDGGIRSFEQRGRALGVAGVRAGAAVEQQPDHGEVAAAYGEVDGLLGRRDAFPLFLRGGDLQRGRETVVEESPDRGQIVGINRLFEVPEGMARGEAEVGLVCAVELVEVDFPACEWRSAEEEHQQRDDWLHGLREPLHPRGEDRLVLFAGDVLGDAGAAALGVAHLAEDPAAGAGDAFDGEQGAVRVDGDVHRGLAAGVDVLRGDLTVSRELGDDFRAGVELAFAMRQRDRVEVAGLAEGKPGRGIADDPGGGVAGDVAADVVVDQGRGTGGGLADLAVGDEAGLDQGLEAVADAEHEAVAVLQQVHDGIGHPRVADDGGDEFRGAVGLVAGAEAAGEHQDLRLADLPREGFERLLDVAGGEIAEDEDLGVGPGFAKGLGGVVFAVGAGEGGDEDPGIDDC